MWCWKSNLVGHLQDKCHPHQLHGLLLKPSQHHLPALSDPQNLTPSLHLRIQGLGKQSGARLAPRRPSPHRHRWCVPSCHQDVSHVLQCGADTHELCDHSHGNCGGTASREALSKHRGNSPGMTVSPRLAFPTHCLAISQGKHCPWPAAQSPPAPTLSPGSLLGNHEGGSWAWRLHSGLQTSLLNAQGSHSYRARRLGLGQVFLHTPRPALFTASQTSSTQRPDLPGKKEKCRLVQHF